MIYKMLEIITIPEVIKRVKNPKAVNANQEKAAENLNDLNKHIIHTHVTHFEYVKT